MLFMMEIIENDYETGLLVEKTSGDRQEYHRKAAGPQNEFGTMFFEGLIIIP